MPITIESLSEQLNQLKQQQVSASNMAQQCAGAIIIVQNQLDYLYKEKQESEHKIQKDIDDSQVDKQDQNESA